MPEKRAKLTEVDKDDARFATADKDFAVDPTNKEYRKIVQGHNKVKKVHRR